MQNGAIKKYFVYQGFQVFLKNQELLVRLCLHAALIALILEPLANLFLQEFQEIRCRQVAHALLLNQLCPKQKNIY